MGTPHEADVIVTDGGGRKKAGLRRILKMPFQILFWAPVLHEMIHHEHDPSCTAWGNVTRFGASPTLLARQM